MRLHTSSRDIIKVKVEVTHTHIAPYVKTIWLNKRRGSFKSSRYRYQFADPEKIAGLVRPGHVERCRDRTQDLRIASLAS